MRKMPVNSLAVKGQLGVLCPLQGCHSFHYRSISHKDEYEIRIAWSNNILSIYINIVSSDNVFWSKTFFVDSNLSVPPASEIIIKRRKHSQRRRPERGRTCDHILTWHSYTTHTHTQTQKHALTQVSLPESIDDASGERFFHYFFTDQISLGVRINCYFLFIHILLSIFSVLSRRFKISSFKAESLNWHGRCRQRKEKKQQIKIEKKFFLWIWTIFTSE